MYTILYTFQKCGIQTTQNNKEVMKFCKTIFLSVKPHFIEMVLKEVADETKDHLFISIAAGVTLDQMQTVSLQYILRSPTGLYLLRDELRLTSQESHNLDALKDSM